MEELGYKIRKVSQLRTACGSARSSKFACCLCSGIRKPVSFPPQRRQARKVIYAQFLNRKEYAHPKVLYVDAEPMRLRCGSLSGTRLSAGDHRINIIRRSSHRITKINALSRRLPKHHRRHTRRICNHRMKPIRHQHPNLYCNYSFKHSHDTPSHSISNQLLLLFLAHTSRRHIRHAVSRSRRVRRRVVV
jgi:hypothetical protein